LSDLPLLKLIFYLNKQGNSVYIYKTKMSHKSMAEPYLTQEHIIIFHPGIYGLMKKNSPIHFIKRCISKKFLLSMLNNY
jgi:hypothetical protein